MKYKIIGHLGYWVSCPSPKIFGKLKLAQALLVVLTTNAKIVLSTAQMVEMVAGEVMAVMVVKGVWED